MVSLSVDRLPRYRLVRVHALILQSMPIPRPESVLPCGVILLLHSVFVILYDSIENSKLPIFRNRTSTSLHLVMRNPATKLLEQVANTCHFFKWDSNPEYSRLDILEIFAQKTATNCVTAAFLILPTKVETNETERSTSAY